MLAIGRINREPSFFAGLSGACRFCVQAAAAEHNACQERSLGLPSTVSRGLAQAGITACLKSAEQM